MADEDAAPGDRTNRERFLRLLNWMKSQPNGTLGVSAVNARTLRRWRSQGPPATASQQYEYLHRWASNHMTDYPPPWEPDGLMGLQYRASRDRVVDREVAAEPVIIEADDPTDTAVDTRDSPPETTTPDTPSAPPQSEQQPSAPADQRSRARRRRVLVSVGVVLAVSGVVGAVVTEVVRPNTPTDTRVIDVFGGLVVIRSCPEKACTGPTIASGSRVAMICWQDFEDEMFIYPSNRWFRVVAVDEEDVAGWAHASQVIGQSNVGHC